MRGPNLVIVEGGCKNLVGRLGQGGTVVYGRCGVGIFCNNLVHVVLGHLCCLGVWCPMRPE